MSWLHELVLKHRADAQLASLFGVILYCDANPHVKKFLRDQDYWRSFDSVSGRHLAVFAFRATAPASQGLELGFMVELPGDPRANSELMEDLGLRSDQPLPAIVWLAHDGEDLLRCVVPPQSGGRICRVEFRGGQRPGHPTTEEGVEGLGGSQGPQALSGLPRLRNKPTPIRRQRVTLARRAALPPCRRR